MWLSKPTTLPITPIYISSDLPIGTTWPFSHVYNGTQKCKFKLLDTLNEAQGKFPSLFLQGGIHTNTITKIWTMSCTPHAYPCMHPTIPLDSTKKLALLMFNKKRLKNHQLPILPTSMQHCKTQVLNSKFAQVSKLDNKMPKPTQLAQL